MKLTNAQIKERENLDWFAPSLERFGPASDEVFKEYLDWSERGVPIKSKFNFYSEAKRIRGITIHEVWENSFYSYSRTGRYGGWVGLESLLKEENGTPIPEHIAKFISKEIFAGQDKEKIMNLYREIKREVVTA